MKVHVSVELNCGDKWLATAACDVVLPAVPQVGHHMNWPEFEDSVVEMVWWDVGNTPTVTVILEDSHFDCLESVASTIIGLRDEGWTVAESGAYFEALKH